MSQPGDSDADKLALARRLRQAREYVGLSQEDVAMTLGITRPAVTNIEAGTRRVEALELKQLSALYCRPVEELLGHETTQEVSHTAFLARATQGLSESDLQELGRFAAFLKSSSKTKQGK
jgi:transcriptional regulator with XRE-family HTH domain